MKRIATLIFVLCISLQVVAADFDSPFVPDANTMGLWHFDETTGASTADDATPAAPGAKQRGEPP